MATLILQILLGFLGLATIIFTWWLKRNADRKKAIDDEDKKIDAVTDADSTLDELDRLSKRPTNR